jgi:RimJ/RimL family protein N-acetyltransferase
MFPGGTVEIGWRLAPEFWGMGYATEAAKAWLAFGFQTLALGEIVSFAVADNRRSTAVMERIGMARDASADFDHPAIGEDYAHLRRHVVYRLARTDWQA